MKRLSSFLLALFVGCLAVSAQVGDHRNVWAFGPNAGWALNKVGFSPDVPQGYHGGITGGLTLRYTHEKYFNTLCAIQAEVNYASLGWKETIETIEGQPVVNPATGRVEAYSRTVNYVQVPVLAHLAWGKEHRGMSFFVNLGPQFGYYLNESTDATFAFDERNMSATEGRTNTIVAQDTMAVEKKFDYGIAAGGGIEFSHPALGHFIVEGRYYYGLGNIYGNRKSDYFGSSNHGTIVIKATYLFDVTGRKK